MVVKFLLTKNGVEKGGREREGDTQERGRGETSNRDLGSLFENFGDHNDLREIELFSLFSFLN